MRSSIIGFGRRSFRGYTILEMAIVIGVAGALFASFGSAYNLYVKQQIQRKTELNASLITSALSNFLIQKGRYPCPARLDAQRSDSDYGMETECNPVQNCDSVAQTCQDNPNYPNFSFNTCPAGNAPPAAPDTANGQGLCFEQSDAYVTIDNFMYAKLAGGIGCYQGNSNANKSKAWCPGKSGAGTIPSKLTIQPAVRRGAIPFRTLAIPEDVSLDGYGNRFQYAVSENQAVTAAYAPNNGGVRILNAQGQSYFNVSMDVPILRPDGIVGTPTQWTAGVNYTYYNESSAAPAVGSTTAIGTTLATNAGGYGVNGQASSIEFSMSNPDTTPYPAGNATVSISVVKTNAGALISTGNPVQAIISIYEAGVLKFTSPASPNLTNTWQQYDYSFDGSQITDWNAVTVKISTNGASANRNMGLGWVQLVTPTPSVGYTDYFMFSSGKDMAGAYTKWGKKLKACATTTLDAANCQTKANARYRMADYSEAYKVDATRCDSTLNCHYDDYSKFYSSTETPLWRVSGTGAHIRDLLNAETTGKKIAIGQAPDTTALPVLQVGGEVRAKSANAMINNICDTVGSNCFNVGKLADATALAANFTCPAGQSAVGFENGALKCSATQTIPCPSGSIVTGVKPDGSLECTSAVGCPAIASTNLCFNSVTGTFDTTSIPSGVQNQTYTTPNSGFNYTETWKCGPNPFWQLQSSSGVCNCAPVDETYDVACNARWTGNWTGNITVHHVHTCPDGNDSVTETANTCVCTNTTETMDDPAGCGPGMTGTVTLARTWDCTSGTAGAWSPYTQTGNTCTCQPQASETRTLTCPTYPASTGTWTQQRDWQCPAGTWTAWTDTTNTCACINGYTEQTDYGCPGGYSGQNLYQRTWDCATQTWSGFTPVAGGNTCTCTPATETQTLTDCGATGFSGTIQQHRDFTCPAATWGSWTTDSNTCTCTGATETRTVSCTAPLAGTKDQRRDYDCPSNSWGSWYDTATNCYANTYNWVTKTAADGPYSNSLATHAGDTCITIGQQQPCSAQAPNGMGYYHYATCQCE